MKVVVAGGTGVIGHHIVDVLAERGHLPVVASRATGVDLTTGSGLAMRLDGAEAVIDVTNRLTLRSGPAKAFFGATSRTLNEAARVARVPHRVVLSVLGADRVPTGYHQGKLLQERVSLASAVPTTVVRATHTFNVVERLAAHFPGRVLPVPSLPLRPVAARDVAEVLVDVALGSPAGVGACIAGPDIMDAVDLLAAYLRVVDGRRRPSPVAPLGAWKKAARGALLPDEHDVPLVLGRTTYASWLTELAQAPAPLQRAS